MSKQIIRTGQAPADLGIVLDSGSANVRDEARLVEVEFRQDLVDDRVDARVLQTDRIQHAARRFRDPVRGVAKTRFERRALQADRADVAVREAFDPRIFLAETDAARQQYNR